MERDRISLDGVREHVEAYPVALVLDEGGRWCIEALNEGGCNITRVDLEDLLRWVDRNKLRVDDMIGPSLVMVR